MFRTLIITLLMLTCIGAMFPLDESTAHGIRQSFVQRRQNRPHYRRHSRAWWRRYRARLRRRRAAAAAYAAHRRQMMLLKVASPTATSTGGANPTPTTPTTWSTVAPANNAEMKFRAETGASSVPGQVALAVVAQSRPTPTYLTSREASRLLGGVATGDLRRIVIDKMINLGGWVTNDYQRDVKGHRVFVVTAQTPGNARSPEKSWNFYFTEINGRIYSVTTNTPRQYVDRMSEEAETFIVSLHTKSTSSPASNR